MLGSKVTNNDANRKIPAEKDKEEDFKQNNKNYSQKGNKNSSTSQKNASLNYSVDKIIGNGTFGVVYLATMTDTGEKVAIKKVFQDKR